MKTVAIIQARMGSTRLPGKVMRKLCGTTMLAHVIRRAAACPRVDQIVVATTELHRDDEVEAESRREGVECFRGSEDDVLSRYYEAARSFSAGTVVRITSDCPLLDPELLTGMLDKFRELISRGSPAAYLSNSLERTYPRGLDIEIFSISALEEAHRIAVQPYEREHVTAYIYEHPQDFPLHAYRGGEDHSHLRWTVDTEADFELVEKIYTHLGKDGRLFTTGEVLQLLASRPELAAINAHVPQKPLKPC